MTDRQELAAVVDGMFDEVLSLIRDAQEANLTCAWTLGGILDKALSAYDDNHGRGIAKELVRRLNEAGCELKLSSLYAYRTIHTTYTADQIPELVRQGLTQTHAQTLAALPMSIRTRVEEQMRKPDGNVVSTRELKRMADDMKKAQAREDSIQVAARSAQARETGDTLTLMPRVSAGAGDEIVGPSAGGDEPLFAPVPADASADRTAGRGDVDRTKAMAAAGSRDFSHPPLKTLKTADSTAIKMLSQAGKILQTLDEAGRVGFDTDRTQQNFIDAVESLDATLASYEKVLPELRERVRSAVNSTMLPD